MNKINAVLAMGRLLEAADILPHESNRAKEKQLESLYFKLKDEFKGDSGVEVVHEMHQPWDYYGMIGLRGNKIELNTPELFREVLTAADNVEIDHWRDRNDVVLIDFSFSGLAKKIGGEDHCKEVIIPDSVDVQAALDALSKSKTVEKLKIVKECGKTGKILKAKLTFSYLAGKNEFADLFCGAEKVEIHSGKRMTIEILYK